MLPQSTATLANSPWHPILGLLLAAGGILLIGTALTFTASHATSSGLSLPQHEVRVAVARSAGSAWLPMRAWPWARFGTTATRAGARFDDRPDLHQVSGEAPTARARALRTEPDQLAAILRRAHLRNPLVVAEDGPHGEYVNRGEHVNRKCPACDVSSGRSDASVD